MTHTLYYRTLFITPGMESYGDVSWLWIPVNKERNTEWKDKGYTMVHGKTAFGTAVS